MHIGGVVGPVDEAGVLDRGEPSKLLSLEYDRFVSVSEDDGRVLAFAGQIYDRHPSRPSSAEELDGAYGYYAYVLYDKRLNEISIGTDRFGYFPIYYTFVDQKLVFSASISYVKKSLRSRTPNYEAWEELFIFGEIIGDKTTVREIRRLGPGTRICVRDSRARFIQYWQPEIPNQTDEHTYIRNNNELLDEAIYLTKHQSRPKVVLLSGGEDSRRLALSAVRQELRVELATQQSIYRGRYNRYVDRDTKLAVHLAARLGQPHHVEPLPSDQQYVADCKHRDDAFGYECIAHAWLMPLVRRVKHESIIFDGIGGDVTINGHYFKEFPRAVEQFSNIGLLSRMIVGETQTWVEQFTARAETPVAERVSTLLASYPDSPHRLTYYFILNHARRKIAWVAQMFSQYGHWTCYPYLYYPLFIQSLSVDPCLQMKDFYQRRCMAAVNPHIAAIPTTRGTLDPHWLIPMDSENERQELFILRRITIRREVFELFPQFRLPYLALRAIRHVSGDLLRRFGWFIPQISRFSAFLDWLQKDQDPPHQQLIRNHFYATR